MTTYTFRPNASNLFSAWDDPNSWTGGVVPNSPDADVVFPLITTVSTGQPYSSFVTIASGESFLVHSVQLDSHDYLAVGGSLTTTADFDAQGEIDFEGGTLNVGSLEINGYDIQGTAYSTVVANSVTNNKRIIEGIAIQTSDFQNNGSIVAVSNDVSVTAKTGSISGSTLTGGSYEADAFGGTVATLSLNGGSLITTDAASMVLAGGIIQSFDPASGTYVSLTSSLRDVAAGGSLTLVGGNYTFGSLVVEGTLSLSNAANVFSSVAPGFEASQLTIAVGGTLTGFGTVSSPIINNGLIESVANTSFDSPVLSLDGPVTGTGSLEISAEMSQVIVGTRNPIIAYSTSSLELGGATSQTVAFNDGTGELDLANPSTFSGKIAAAPSGGDRVLLENVLRSSITGVSYSGDSSGGTLTLQEATGAVALNFIGDYDVSSFTVAATPQQLSSDPQYTVITVGRVETPPTVSFDTVSYTDTGFAGDGLTTDPTVMLSGTQTSATGIEVYDGSRDIGAAAINPDGTWSLTTALTGGLHDSFTAVAAGTPEQSSVTATNTTSLTVDTTTPAVSINVNAAGFENGTTALLTGTAGSSYGVSGVEIYNGDQDLGAATINPNGTWTFQGVLGPGDYANLTATATALSGATASAFLDTDVALPALSFDDVNYTATGNGLTNSSAVTLSGKEICAKGVEVYDGTTDLGAATVGADGTWSLSTTLADGTHDHFSAVAIGTPDALTATAVNPTNLTVDTSLAVAFDGTTAGFENGRTPLLTGTVFDTYGVSGVEIYDGDIDLGAAAVNSDGTWTFGGELGSSDYSTLTAVATANSGMTASASAPYELVTGIAGAPYRALEYDYGGDGSYSYDAYGAHGASLVDAADNFDGTHSIEAAANDQQLYSIHNDTMTGNGTGETFVFFPNFGRDEVTDFRATGSGHDYVDLTNTQMHKLAQVIAHTTMQGGNAVLHLYANETVTLDGVTKAQLKAHPGNFLFA